ncbi:MAG: hypothetical protein ACLUOI_12220 [Eisenbergiella sp.]
MERKDINEEVLLKERESQISLAAWDDCVMDSADGQASFCWISAMRSGGIRILAWKDSTDRGRGPDPVRESVMEAMSEPGGKAMPPTIMREGTSVRKSG